MAGFGWQVKWELNGVVFTREELVQELCRGNLLGAADFEHGMPSVRRALEQLRKLWITKDGTYTVPLGYDLDGLARDVFYRFTHGSEGLEDADQASVK